MHITHPIVATWDREWKKYNNHPYFKPNHKVLTEILKCFYGNVSQKKIIELGAGSGSDIISLAQAGAKAYALDFSKESLTSISYWEKKKNIKIQKKQADIKKLPFNDNFFDLVYSVGLMEHFQNPIPYLREQLRIVTHGGFLLIDVPQKYTLYTIMKHIRMMRGKHPFGWETEYSKTELIAIANALNQPIKRIYGRDFDVIMRIPDKCIFKKKLTKWYAQVIEPSKIASYISLCIGIIIQKK